MQEAHDPEVMSDVLDISKTVVKSEKTPELKSVHADKTDGLIHMVSAVQNTCAFAGVIL